MFIPGNPILTFSSLFGFNTSSKNKAHWFSYFRHALISYLCFLNETHRPIRTILLPDYMCHEVVTSLRNAGYEIIFYHLKNEFEINIQNLENFIQAGQHIDVMIAVHFYGKIVKNLSAIAELCQKNNIVLIEDCAHVPNDPSILSKNLVSDARIFSHRKLFAVPEGAQIILKNDHEQFGDFIRNKIKSIYGPSYFEIAKWIARSLLKKLLFSFNIRFKRRYHDLSQDTLKSYHFSRPCISYLLKPRDIKFCIEQRRKNYISYMSKIVKISNWLQPIKFDISIDIPYQLLITLRQDVDHMDFIKFLLERGVAAVLGMAIDKEVLKRLPEDHVYRHHVSLPLHQSLSEKHIHYVCDLLEEYQTLKGLKI